MGESTRVTLPSGHWVELMDPHDMTGAHYRVALSAVTDWGQRGRWPLEVRGALLGRVVKNWDYEQYPLPVTTEVLDMMPIADARELYNAVTPHFQLVMSITVTPTVDGYDDEASPTGGSSE